MKNSRLLANTTLLAALFSASPALAQSTTIDAFDVETFLALLGETDSTGQSVTSRDRVGSGLAFDVCRITRMSQSSTGVNRRPESELHVNAGQARLEVVDLDGSAVRTYGASMRYGRCNSTSTIVTAMGVAVPTSFSFSVTGIPAADRPTFIINAFTSDSGSNVTHTLALTPTANGTVTFTGSSFTPALPTSGTAVLNNVTLIISGSQSTSATETLTLSNFVMN